MASLDEREGAVSPPLHSRRGTSLSRRSKRARAKRSPLSGVTAFFPLHEAVIAVFRLINRGFWYFWKHKRMRAQRALRLQKHRLQNGAVCAARRQWAFCGCIACDFRDFFRATFFHGVACGTKTNEGGHRLGQQRRNCCSRIVPTTALAAVGGIAQSSHGVSHEGRLTSSNTAVQYCVRDGRRVF